MAALITCLMVSAHQRISVITVWSFLPVLCKVFQNLGTDSRRLHTFCCIIAENFDICNRADCFGRLYEKINRRHYVAKGVDLH